MLSILENKFVFLCAQWLCHLYFESFLISTSATTETYYFSNQHSHSQYLIITCWHFLKYSKKNHNVTNSINAYFVIFRFVACPSVLTSTSGCTWSCPPPWPSSWWPSFSPSVACGPATRSRWVSPPAAPGDRKIFLVTQIFLPGTAFMHPISNTNKNSLDKTLT